jgi:hypothetical protein
MFAALHYPLFPEIFVLALSATSLKSTNWRFSSLNHQNYEFFGLVPKSPTHTGLICVKTTEPNISNLGLFKNFPPIDKSVHSSAIGQKLTGVYQTLT